MSANMHHSELTTDTAEQEILHAVRGIRFGIVEVVVHESRITEIRQTKRVRIHSTEQRNISTYPTPGGSKINQAGATLHVE